MHNILSPRTCDAGIEQEIQAKGLTAPRVTPSDLEANIVTEVYFTAADGATGPNAILIETHGNDPDIQATHDSLKLVTFCVLRLKNGFTVVGESACVSAENFHAEIGRRVARENAKQKMWPLMGYALQQQLSTQA